MIVAYAMLLLNPEPDCAQWGREALEMLRRDYYLPKQRLYSEHPDRKQPAFNWGVGVMLSALNAAATYDAKYKPSLREYADASRIYWNDGGYDVLPAPKPKDRYYDDNAWMALSLVETYRVLGDKKYLTWAREALGFALEGEAKEGGIYWRETDRASRNTCSNAPTAAACLAIYSVTKDVKLLEAAERVYVWTRKTLEDPADGLFWDSINNNGTIDKTKWTYNSALMIRTGFELRAAGKDGGPLDRLVASSRAKWLSAGKIDDPGRFAHLIMEAWLQAGIPADDLMSVLKTLDWGKSMDGHYPSHWSKLNVPKNPEILDQASFARACFHLANTLR